MEASKRSLYPRHLVSEVVQPGHQVNLAPLLYLEASSRATGYGISQMAPHSGFPNSPTTLSRTNTCDLAQFKSAFFLSHNHLQTIKSERVQNFRSVGPSDGAAGPSLRCDCRNLTALLLPSHSALSLLGDPLTPSTTLRKYKIHCFSGQIRKRQIKAKDGGRLNMQAGKKEHTKEDL